jgi:glycerol-3-phosphate dehydrogenase
MNFSAENRSNVLRAMASEELDLLVIGGGITGAGIAWDASLRGMKAGLLEMRDFSWGTSSRSTKLVHGGLRYLKQGEVKLVMEVGRERALLYERAPHIVIPAPMLLPIYEGGTFGKLASSIGLYIYDWLAGVKRKERRKMLNKEETLAVEPLFKPDGLKGSGFYYEYRTDDSRLTIEVLKTAQSNGAYIANYIKASEFIYHDGRLIGVKAKDALSGATYDIYAKKIVNAAGPWVDQVRKKDHSLHGKKLRLTKGVHLVIDYEKLPLKQSAYFDVPGGRMIFVIPRGKKTYIGTTDTVYEGEIEDPRITEEDRDYLISSVNAVFPSVRLTPHDIESGWAGLRPLVYEEGKGPSEISRKDEVIISDSGLITIAGGKLTGFRKMAQKVVDLVSKELEEEQGLPFLPCTTDQQTISGGDRAGYANYEDYKQELWGYGKSRGLTESHLDYILSTYGSNTAHIYNYFDTMDKEEDVDRRMLLAESTYGIEHEMAVTPADFVVRRTGLVYFDRRRAERVFEEIVSIMAERFCWSEEQINAYRNEVLEEFKKARPISVLKIS